MAIWTRFLPTLEDMPRNIESEPIDRAIGAILKGAMRTESKTQEQVAQTSGIPLVTVQRLLGGKSAWKVSQFLSIVDAIGGPRNAEVLFSDAVAYLPHLPAIEDNVSEAPSNVTDITSRGEKEFVWQGEENAFEEWDAVAKSSDSTIEIDPDTHTP